MNNKLELQAEHGMLIIGVACVLLGVLSIRCRADECVVMVLDTRASAKDQKTVTKEIQKITSDKAEIDLAKVAQWHLAKDYERTAWVLSLTPVNIERQGGDKTKVSESEASKMTAKADATAYLQWLASSDAYHTLRDAGYIASTNKAIR